MWISIAFANSPQLIHSLSARLIPANHGFGVIWLSVHTQIVVLFVQSGAREMFSIIYSSPFSTQRASNSCSLGENVS